MWEVSDRFLNAIRYPHKTRTTVTLTTDDGDTTLNLINGTIACDTNSRIRRTGTLTLDGDNTTYQKLTNPAAVITINHGLVYGNTTELIPVFTGFALNPQRRFGDGTITVSLRDYAYYMVRQSFTSPYAPSTSTTRPAAIQALIEGRTPATVTNTATDTGTIASDSVWTQSPWDPINQLATDGGMEVFFTPDGNAVIRDLPSLTQPPVWTATSGEFGVLETATLNTTTDMPYNQVIVRPTATDGSQTWTQQTATVAASDPRHPDNIGDVPFILESATITNASDALTLASQKLEQLTAPRGALSLTTVANPALEGNDVIRVITPNLNREAGTSFQHFIESFTLNLNTGSMDIRTRAQVFDD